MGFFSTIASSAVQANEDAHGDRLLNGVKSSLDKMNAMLLKEGDEMRVACAAIEGFNDIRSQLMASKPNWSRDGRLRKAKELQDHAKTIFDFNLADSYAEWLSGAWLECGERNSVKAKEALRLLSEVG